MNVDKIYLDIVKHILANGTVKSNRTGIDTISVSGYMFEYNMAEGFPLLTTKQMAWKTIRVELEGFIKGITDKQWFKDRGCNIWNEWCNPTKVQYGNDKVSQAKMKDENDLGPIYGYQWRNWNGRYMGTNKNADAAIPDVVGIDQLEWAINQVKNNPNNRRIIVNAWNPEQLYQMALVPCHYSFQLLCNNGTLDLLWNQRSVDTALGLPFNIASYGLLLELIAKECNLIPGKLIGFLADVHLYENTIEGVKLQLEREPFNAPTLILDDNVSVFDWTWENAKLDNYKCHGKIKMEVAV